MLMVMPKIIVAIPLNCTPGMFFITLEKSNYAERVASTMDATLVDWGS